METLEIGDFVFLLQTLNLNFEGDTIEKEMFLYIVCTRSLFYFYFSGLTNESHD